MRGALIGGFGIVLLCGIAAAQGIDVHPETTRVAVPEPTAEALSFRRSGNIVWAVQRLLGLAFPATVLALGLSARIRDWALRWGRKWFFTICLYFIALRLLAFFVNLPLEYYDGFVRPHSFGLSNQTFQKWAHDEGVRLVLSVAVGTMLMWLPYLLLKKSPRRWWLYTWLAMIPVVFIGLIIQPIWIAPLFNDFSPMQDKALEADILALAARAGIEDGRVYEVAKSADTNALNASVHGWAPPNESCFGTRCYRR